MPYTVTRQHQWVTGGETMPKYTVHVVHEYFEAGDFEVEASDEEHAEALARGIAMSELIDPELVSVEANATLKSE